MLSQLGREKETTGGVSRISDRTSDGSSGVRRRSRLSRNALATPADYFEAARHGFQQIGHEGGWISKAGHRHGSGSGGGNGMPDGGNGVVLRSRGSGVQICGSRDHTQTCATTGQCIWSWILIRAPKAIQRSNQQKPRRKLLLEDCSAGPCSATRAEVVPNLKRSKQQPHHLSPPHPQQGARSVHQMAAKTRSHDASSLDLGAFRASWHEDVMMMISEAWQNDYGSS
ncbi:hypothetical protein L1987_09487 [Smallanthus sonchifolius]|uniref:Uncharacterized protein n=1 Tax=Smallanthus sonchifolius TaxID=185202 RepID=A0ACB9JPL8_9ASTR|nr:hypothetical protein L1987_09487 [Smallanthus sonchifolius]